MGRFTGDIREMYLEQALLRRAHRSAQVRAAAAEKQRRREAAERSWSPAAAAALTDEYARQVRVRVGVRVRVRVAGLNPNPNPNPNPNAWQYERRVAQDAAARLLAPRRPQAER